jgi:NAD(P)H dehydrogenase (quinone)
MIVVTAATGKLGVHVVEALLAKVPAKEIAVVVRHPEKAKAFADRGVEVRRGDYAEPASLAEAFRAGDKVLLISSSEVGQRAVQHGNVLAAAQAAKVGLLVYTSILRGERSKLALAAEHIATEAAVRASGLPYVFLRNGWYLENYTENLASALAHGVLLGSAGEGRIAAASRADFAAAAVAVLTGEGPTNAVYELAGDASFSMRELAAAVATEFGKEVAYQDLPAAEYEAALVGFGVPAPFAHILADADAGIAEGELDDASHALSQLIGRPTETLAALLAAAHAVGPA